MSKIPRLSEKEAAILTLLVSGGESYGLQLVKNSGGRLKRGTVYVTLGRMEDKGYVESKLEPRRKDQVGPSRRVYRATGHGKAVINAWQRYLEFVKQSGFALGGV